LTAGRHTIRLYWRSTRELQQDHNIDPRSDTALRQLLEQLVKQKRGTLNLDLSEWRIDVHRLGGGRIKARCKVTRDGQTEIKR
jgi:hypothetical protein